MRQIGLVLAPALALSALPTTATAAVPAGFGLPCRYAGTLGHLERGPEQHYEGVIAGGPWVMPRASSTTITCTVESQEKVFDSRSMRREGTTTFLVTTTSFVTIPPDMVYLCTYIAVNDGPAERVDECAEIQPGEGPTP